MQRKYSCPRCSSLLNPGPRIVLLGRQEGNRILFAFHPEPGNYEVAFPDDALIRKGEVWEFLCPVCHETLNVAGNDPLAALDMTDGAGNWHKVVFSRVFGEQATFVIPKDQKMEVEEYGVNFSKYDRCLWERYL